MEQQSEGRGVVHAKRAQPSAKARRRAQNSRGGERYALKQGENQGFRARSARFGPEILPFPPYFAGFRGKFGVFGRFSAGFEVFDGKSDPGEGPVGRGAYAGAPHLLEIFVILGFRACEGPQSPQLLKRKLVYREMIDIDHRERVRWIAFKRGAVQRLIQFTPTL